MKTLYDILEVSATARPQTIDASYRRLVAECPDSPDRDSANRPDSGHRLDAIERAYATLSDPSLRRDYDAHLAELPDPAPTRRPAGALGERRTLAIVAAIVLTASALLYLAPASRGPGTIATSPVAASGSIPERAPERPAIAPPATAVSAGEPNPLAARPDERQERPPQTALELEVVRLQHEIRMMREEQEMRARALEQQADLAERRMRIEEQHAQFRTREEEAQSVNHRMSEKLGQIQTAIDAQKDLNAAKMGISRYQYDRLQEGQWQTEARWR